MKKTYKLTDLCCANCAAEIERGIAKIKGVTLCNVNFVMQKLTFETAEGGDDEAVIKKVKKIIRRVEPDCDMVEIG